jgi:transcriptional regulator with XRE-family HTH domain
MRALLKQREWSQAELADRSGLTQGAISRAADPDYGNLTFNNVLKIAAGFDVAFVGKFVPFSELASWHDSIADETTLMVNSFDEDAEPQTKEESFEAALAKHAAAPAPLEYQSDSPDYTDWLVKYIKPWTEFVATSDSSLAQFKNAYYQAPGEGLTEAIQQLSGANAWYPVQKMPTGPVENRPPARVVNIASNPFFVSAEDLERRKGVGFEYSNSAPATVQTPSRESA